MTSTRQLAAILFTDIEGYTAIMQKEEDKAIAMKDRHRDVLEKQHKQYNGQLKQYYGDGTLSIFTSVIEAVQCAIAMQQAFAEHPLVPVRMGLHFGDIIINEESIFGDGVNIASRIESLGVPGCVMISDKVNDEIHNHPEFRTVSMGFYQLKNVERIVEVFAIANEKLVVPGPSSLKGKAKKVRSGTTRGSQKARLNYKSIAVFPFRNISNDSSIEWLSDGFTEELTSAIAGISDLKVKSSTAMKQYKNISLNFDQIAEELNVANFMEGNVQKLGTDILINSNLINSKTGEILKPFRFKKDFSEINFIYSEIAQNVADSLKAILNYSEKKKLRQPARVNPHVHQLFLQGMYILQKIDYKEIPKAIQLFEEALEAEPDYAPALAGKANCYVTLGYLGAINRTAVLENVMPLLIKALQIDPNLAFIHTNLGWTKLWFEWDIKGAAKEFTIAHNIDPSDVLCIRGNVFLNIYSGNFEKARLWLKKGIAVSPNDIWLTPLHGMLFYFENKTDDAIQLLIRSILTHNHILSYSRLGWIYDLIGDYKKAIATLEDGLQKFNVRRAAVLSWLAIAYYKDGETEKANQIFNELEGYIKSGKPNNAFYTAVAYAFIGKNDDAFRLLKKSYEMRDLDFLWLKFEPMLKSLIKEPRYIELLKVAGFN
ncbi:MAG TPA: adenylate/guanylate cyclase domain-containing protein [Chitinophagaceae bacterium]|nr:adenylate/guanylate cyclase domain-containing protein [Chitinophagaceae bacterium]